MSRGPRLGDDAILPSGYDYPSNAQPR